MPSPKRRLALLLVLAASAPAAAGAAPSDAPAPAAAASPAPAPWVVPAGREDLLLQMLGKGAALPGGCSLQAAAVERVQVRATYACDAGAVALVLQHPEAASAPGATTARFALTADPAAAADLLAAVAARVRDGEASWEWTRGTRSPGGAEPDAPTPEADPRYPRPELPPDQQAEYDRAEALIKADRLEDALAVLDPLARKAPISKVLGLVVVALAPRATDTKRVAAEQAAADANPSDPLPNFRAGVITHYAGHRYARDRDQKADFYRKALAYLGRTLPAYEQVSRTWIYSAVSHYRLGQQAEAEAAIEKAIVLSERSGDADAWYCRAEVWHRKDLKKALADIDRYIEIMKVNVAQGAIHSAAKDARVAQMKDILQKAASGEAPLGDEELFDPVTADGAHPLAPDGPGGGPDPRLLAGIGLAVVLAAAAAVAWIRRRRA